MLIFKTGQCRTRIIRPLRGMNAIRAYLTAALVAAGYGAAVSIGQALTR